MKKTYFLFLLLLVFVAKPVFAGNILGGELTYYCVSPGNYMVNFNYSQLCAATPAPVSVTLNLNSPGCNSAGRLITLNATFSGNKPVIPDFCPKAPVPACAPFSQPGYGFLNQYQGLIHFSAAELNCQNWVMGVTIDTDSRANTANLAGNAPFYLEAYLKLSAPGTSPINNNAVEFGPLNFSYIRKFEPGNLGYQLNPSEIDGDSLVYSLRPAMQAPATPVTYTTGFSALNPFATPVAPVLTSTSGLLAGHIPFVKNTLPAQGLNRYSAVFQIDEYRKRNGVSELIGSVQRALMFEIIPFDTVQNLKPALTNFLVNGLPSDPKVPLILTAGQPATVTFRSSDPDSLDWVQIHLDSLYLSSIGLARFKIQQVLKNQQVEITFTPTIGHAQALPYYLPVRLEDDACPVKHIVMEVLTIEVRNALGTQPERAGNTRFTAFPNPFTESVSFRTDNVTKAESILIYNLLGQQVDKISIPDSPDGPVKVTWEKAPLFASGTYLARLLAKDKTIQTLKFTKLP